MGGMDALVGGRDLMEMIGLDPNSKDDVDRLTAWLSRHEVPYMSIGRAVRGRRRGILISAEALNAALETHFAERLARRAERRADAVPLSLVEAPALKLASEHDETITPAQALPGCA